METEQIKTLVRYILQYHIENHKEPDVNITFIFKGKDFKFTEKIWIFGDIKYKGISFDKESALKVIPNNFYYNDFILKDKYHSKTPVKCHGFGDYWATEKHKYIFERK